MSGDSIKAKEFTKFRQSVLERMRGGEDKLLYQPDMDSYYLSPEKGSEEKEVKLNMRFLTK